MRFDGDIVITDPCYVMRRDRNGDWERCCHGDDMEVFGFRHYLTEFTIYGDWSCTTYLGELSERESHADFSPERVLGTFCADSGLVSVFYLEDILRYNPNFVSKFLEKSPWTATIVRDFHGEIELVTIVEEPEDTLHVVGIGNIHFFTELDDYC